MNGDSLGPAGFIVLDSSSSEYEKRSPQRQVISKPDVKQTYLVVPRKVPRCTSAMCKRRSTLWSQSDAPQIRIESSLVKLFAGLRNLKISSKGHALKSLWGSQGPLHGSSWHRAGNVWGTKMKVTEHKQACPDIVSSEMKTNTSARSLIQLFSETLETGIRQLEGKKPPLFLSLMKKARRRWQNTALWAYCQ